MCVREREESKKNPFNHLLTVLAYCVHQGKLVSVSTDISLARCCSFAVTDEKQTVLYLHQQLRGAGKVQSALPN